MPAICFWAAYAAVEGAEVLSGALGVPADELLVVEILGGVLVVILTWNPGKGHRSGGDRYPRSEALPPLSELREVGSLRRFVLLCMIWPAR